MLQEPNSKQCAWCGYVYSESDDVTWQLDDEKNSVCEFCYDKALSDRGDVEPDYDDWGD